MAVEWLKIRNWDRWQSYRSDRGQPPWIKIHRAVMRNWEWMELTDAQRGQLVAIWLLAADREGVIPASPGRLKTLCNMWEEPDLQLFIDKGFIEQPDTPLDATVTPERRQSDAPEKRRGEKSRREKKPPVTQARPSAPKVSDETVERIFNHWRTVCEHPRSKLDEKIAATIRKWMTKSKQVPDPYTESDIMSAITGCSKTPHNMGFNDRQTKYTSIVKIILKDADNINRFIENDRNPPAMPVNEGDAIKAWSTLKRAISAHGRGSRPTFKDKGIETALDTIGGWGHICTITARDLEFLQSKFKEAYCAVRH